MGHYKSIYASVVTIAFLAQCAHSNVSLFFSSGSENRQVFEYCSYSCRISAVELTPPMFSLSLVGLPVGTQMVTLRLRAAQLDFVFMPIVNISSDGTAKVSLPTTIYGDSTEVTEDYTVILVDSLGSEQTVYRKSYLIRKSQDFSRSLSISLPFYSMLATQTIALVVLVLASCNVHYRWITPIRFNIPITFLYLGFLFSMAYLPQIINQSDTILRLTGTVLASIVCIFYTIDLLMAFTEYKRVSFSVGIIFVVLLAGFDDFIFTDMWALNTILAILFTAAAVKFIIIRKLKTSLIPLGLLWVGFIVREYAVSLRFQNQQQALSLRLLPLYIQVPAILGDNQQGYPCSAFSNSKLIAMGLLFNYSVRVDIACSTHLYKAVCLFVAVACMGLEILLDSLLDDLPNSQFLSAILFLPICTGVLLWVATRRNEWSVIWSGSFHDMAVNRLIIRKDTSLMSGNDNSDNNSDLFGAKDQTQNQQPISNAQKYKKINRVSANW